MPAAASVTRSSLISFIVRLSVAFQSVDSSSSGESGPGSPLRCAGIWPSAWRASVLATEERPPPPVVLPVLTVLEPPPLPRREAASPLTRRIHATTLATNDIPRKITHAGAASLGLAPEEI